MDGLPKDVDLRPLFGRRIDVVSISKFIVNIYLDDAKPIAPDILIAIESDKVLFTASDGKSTEISDFRTGGGLFCHLLGLTIKNASRRNDGGLILDMSDSSRVEIAVHTPMYE